MTSGIFHSIEIASIIINRAERQRRELKSVPELAESISRLGLIHPIVIRSSSKELVVGERRLEACRSLGWTHIPAQFIEELDESALRAVELEENIKRVDLTWQEEALAIHAYHQIRLSDPTWNVTKTSEALGISQQSGGEKIRVAAELLAGNERVAEAPKFSIARGIVERKLDRAAASEIAQVEKIDETPAAPPLVHSILHVDFIQWTRFYKGPKFNFIHCDFPYGINADKFNQSSAHSHGEYKDDEDTYFRLLNHLTDNLDVLCADSCHILFWFSMQYYHRTLEHFRTHSDFVIDPFPLIWWKNDNSGILPDPSRGPRRVYETALFGSRGDRKIVRSKSNVFAAPLTRGLHMSEKNQDMLEHFFTMFVDEHTLMLDPTCGSGSSIRAAARLGAAKAAGLEINEEFAEAASLALKRHG